MPNRDRRDEARAYRAAHREEARAYQKAWQAANPDKTREYQAAYYASHRERMAAKNAAYRAAHLDKARQSARSYGLSDPWRVVRSAKAGAHRSARRFGVETGSLTYQDFARLHLLPCAYCGVLPANGVDHVVAMVNGGPNRMDNLVPACLPCNHIKYIRPVMARAAV